MNLEAPVQSERDATIARRWAARAIDAIALRQAVGSGAADVVPSVAYLIAHPRDALGLDVNTLVAPALPVANRSQGQSGRSRSIRAKCH